MKRAALLVGLLACSDSPSEPEIINLTDTWTFSQGFSNSQLGMSCNAEGSAVIAQSDANFTGNIHSTLSCSAGGESIAGEISEPIRGGTVDGRHVTFAGQNVCDFEGDASGNPPNRITGEATCTFSFEGQNYEFFGPWEMTR